jgi:hypothetical protein
LKRAVAMPASTEPSFCQRPSNRYVVGASAGSCQTSVISSLWVYATRAWVCSTSVRAVSIMQRDIAAS